MVHNEIHAIDLAIIAAYLIAMVLIGLVVVKKVKTPVLAVAFAPVLKAAKCLCKDVYLKEVSTTFLRKKLSLSM